VEDTHTGTTLPDLMKAEAQQIVAEGNARKLHLRLLGAIAFQVHCPKYSFLTAKLGRVLTDLDLAAYGRERGTIEKMMRDLGYSDNPLFTGLFGHRRMVWDKKSNGLHVDIFFDKLVMNHEIPFANRLELEEYTIPLADMVLEKMQIVHINEKDVIDTIMLLREHPVGHSEKEMIDGGYMAKLLSNDWGFYYTVTSNLKKVRELLPKYPELTTEDRTDISDKAGKLLMVIEDEQKSMSWKVRSRLGTKRKWYAEVEEIATMS
jgi:hypothetical protein